MTFDHRKQTGILLTKVDPGTKYEVHPTITLDLLYIPGLTSIDLHRNVLALTKVDPHTIYGFL